jgi:Na+-driven multidrug efflux pump
LIAYRIGECRFEDAHRQLLQSFRWALFGSVGLVILLNLLQEPILGAFTQDQEIQRLCGPLLLLSIPLEVGRTSNIVAGGALRASGDARYVGVMGSCVMWLFAVPLAAFLCLRLNLGLIGIWVAMAADECVRGAFNLLRWNSGMWRRYGVLKLLPEH